MSSNLRCAFRWCWATYVSMFALSNHEQECKDQHHCVQKTIVFVAALAPVQTIHVLNVNRTTWPYSASFIEEENDSMESFIDSPYINRGTDIRNDDICMAAELIFGESLDAQNNLRQSFWDFFVEWVWLQLTLKIICTHYERIKKFWKKFRKPCLAWIWNKWCCRSREILGRRNSIQFACSIL